MHLGIVCQELFVSFASTLLLIELAMVETFHIKSFRAIKICESDEPTV